jgi:uncharacterized repeat protein (TIGR03803 family)
MPASVTTIASFPTPSATTGAGPDGQLFIDSKGDLLGATVLGGADGHGTTYEIAKVAGGYASTPTFLADIPDGLNTLANVPNLSADANGDLFGLMITGGANSLGTVVEFPAGGGAAITLVNFSGGAGGSQPAGQLLVDASGNLFGTTASGGASNTGIVFELQKTGNSYAITPTVLASFGPGVTPNGAGNLVEDAAGDLFGTTTDSVFEVQKNVAAPVLISFPTGTEIGNGLTIDANGDIFGTTISGGAEDDGTVFEILKNTSTPITLASFSPADGELSLNHTKTLIVDANGDLFGTTDPSSQNSGGVVFEIVKTSTGYNPTPTIVANFNGMTDVGLGANLVADANGNLFGTTQTGGANNNSGSAFEITDSGFVPTILLTAGANASYAAGAAPVALDAGLSISGPNLTGATVSIGAGFHAGDALAVGSPQSGITSSYNAGTGVLTLTSTVALSPAIYQLELDSVTFASVAALNPTSRTISWSLAGSANSSAQASSSVAVFVSNSDFDIRLQNTNGGLALWQASGAAAPTISAAALLGPQPGATWFAVGSGGFFSGGASDASDIVLQNANGAVNVWQMQGATFLSGNAVANPGSAWHVEATGDFNGDGKTDIALQNTNGNVSVWEMSNGQISQAGAVANPGSAWHIEATGDFNQDGKSDIVLQNTNGQVNIWNMNGTQISQSAVVANPGPSWHVEGTGDFFGNGQSDILLQNNNGNVEIWQMNGDQISQGIAVANPGAAWHVASTGDFNQDGMTDITLQNNNGAVAVWDMDGGQIIHSSVLANPGPTWSVTGDGRHSSIS